MSEWTDIAEAPKDGTPVILGYPDGSTTPAFWSFSPNANKSAWCGIESVGGAVLPYSEQDAVVFKLIESPKETE